MIENIERLQQEANDLITSAPDPEGLDRLRVQYLGKKGVLTGMLHQLRDLPPDKKKELGALLNEIKTNVERNIEKRKVELERSVLSKELDGAPDIDITLPGIFPATSGSLHPITKVMDQMTECLQRIGFSVATGPEVETEFFNFEALNMPADHPARDTQDTFYLEPAHLLRTHTSPVQIRTMMQKQPPIQVIALGKVYRSDFDITHTPMFHQMEGLMVDRSISLSHLKGILNYLVKDLFGARPLRFRPSYFPFTEPSAEVDMQCIQCKGNGSDCRLCKSTGWLEIGGCGMIHPNVFKAVNYNAEDYTGFAFGMGIERIAMLKYGIDDLRSFFENDYRMLEQF